MKKYIQILPIILVFSCVNKNSNSAISKAINENQENISTSEVVKIDSLVEIIKVTEFDKRSHADGNYSQDVYCTDWYYKNGSLLLVRKEEGNDLGLKTTFIYYWEKKPVFIRQEIRENSHELPYYYLEAYYSDKNLIKTYWGDSIPYDTNIILKEIRELYMNVDTNRINYFQ